MRRWKESQYIFKRDGGDRFQEPLCRRKVDTTSREAKSNKIRANTKREGRKYNIGKATKSLKKREKCKSPRYNKITMKMLKSLEDKKW